MKTILHGRVDKPVVAVVGVWDPMLKQHRELFEELQTYAERETLTPLVIILDPDPGVHMLGASKWPVFDDIDVRVKMLHQLGFEAVLRVYFERQDLRSGAPEFFEIVQSAVKLQELWLGATQPLGSRFTGGPEVVNQVAEKQSVNIRRLPDRTDLPVLGKEVRTMLSKGQIREAARLVGRPPVYSRPQDGAIEIAWQPGLYKAMPLEELTIASSRDCVELTVTQQSDGRQLLNWPDNHIPYLAFVVGPDDL